MTFLRTTAGAMQVRCNGSCGRVLEQTAENKGVNLLDFMRDAGWALGPNLCPGCQDGTMKAEAAGLVSLRKDAWDNVVEISPGIWAEASAKPFKVEVSGHRAGKATRRRKMRKLL